MAITAQDLIRFGLIRDPKAYLDAETKRWNDYYTESIQRQQQRLRESTSDTQYTLRSASLEETVKQREERFNIIDRRYSDLLREQDRDLEDPGIISAATRRIEEEIGEQRRQLQEKAQAERARMQEETEGIQRTTAERESARIRSRRAGAGGGRSMLSGYSLAVPQAIGGRSTLGRPVQTGGSAGAQSAMTLGRSLLG